jgi:hypothetical protein
MDSVQLVIGVGTDARVGVVIDESVHQTHGSLVVVVVGGGTLVDDVETVISDDWFGGVHDSSKVVLLVLWL